MKPAETAVPVASIRTEMEARTTQMRLNHHDETIEDYANAFRRGAKFPAVDLVPDGSGAYFIADGWHRVLGAKLAKHKHIRARILPVAEGQKPLETALRHALRANRDHGLRLTRGDQRNKARRAIEEVPGMADMTDRRIAREIDVSHQTVSRARNELVCERRIPHSVTGERMDDLMPNEYASVQAFNQAFGTDGVETYHRVRDYLAQLKAGNPKDWRYDPEEGRVYHSGLLLTGTAAFPVEDNPIVDGLPRDWEAIEDPADDPTGPMTQDKRDMIERMAAQREFAEAKARIEARGRADLTAAARTLAKYRRVPGLFEDLRALVLAGGPPQEHAAEDF